MMARIVGLFILALCTLPADARAQRAPVDLELVFVVDASGSIDDEETRLQRQGYVDALVNPRILSAVSSGFTRSIAVAYIEFAATGCERMTVPWTRITDSASAKSFGERILAAPRMFCPGGNAIGDAIDFAAGTIESNAFDGTRRVIDVSGDGPNTRGGPVELARDQAVIKGITINGLVIERPGFPDLDEYYRSAVTGGARSFVIMAESRATFAEAILKKMILEIAGHAPTVQQAVR